VVTDVLDDVTPPLDDRPEGKPANPKREGERNGLSPAAAAAAAAAADDEDDDEDDDDDVDDPYREGNKAAIWDAVNEDMAAASAAVLLLDEREEELPLLPLPLPLLEEDEDPVVGVV